MATLAEKENGQLTIEELKDAILMLADALINFKPAKPLPADTLTITQWLRLNKLPYSHWTVKLLIFAEEKMEQGYDHDQIVKLCGWQRKRNFLPIFAKFYEDWTRKE